LPFNHQGTKTPRNFLDLEPGVQTERRLQRNFLNRFMAKKSLENVDLGALGVFVVRSSRYRLSCPDVPKVVDSPASLC